MKKNFFLKLSFAILAMAAMFSCSPEEEAPTVQPVVRLTAGETTTETIAFTIVSEQAEQVAWVCLEATDAVPEVEAVLADGVAIEANTTVELKLFELQPATTYTIWAAAANKDHTVLSEPLELTTTSSPTVTLEAGDVAENTLKFTLSTTNAEEVRWVSIVAGSRTVTAEQVFQNGTEAEANTTVEITVENLTALTDYEIYAVAKAGDMLVMGEMLQMSTIYIPREYTIAATEASSTFSIGSSNYYVSFANPKKGEEFYADIYVEDGTQYLPSGTYVLGGYEPGELSADYTDCSVSEEAFASGELVVVATPNEETREIVYTISGEFFYENGDKVILTYEGIIDGLSLPAADVPEGYYPFVPDPATYEPYRRKVNGEKPGEYVFVFTDEFWGELIIDIYADPALCDNGNAGIPDGTYSLADGTMDSYSQVIFYEPDYWYCNFSRCEVTVTHLGGEQYAFVVDATGSNGSSERDVWMTFEGRIKDMTRE